jgi:hypothetical protein
MGEIEDEKHEANRHSFSLLRVSKKRLHVSPDISYGGSVYFWGGEDNHAPLSFGEQQGVLLHL